MIVIEHDRRPDLFICQRERNGVAERGWSIGYTSHSGDSAGFLATAIEDRDIATAMATGLALTGRFSFRSDT